MSKNSHDRMLKVKPKKQHLSTIPKSCPIYIYIYIQIVKDTIARGVRREKKTLVNPYYKGKSILIVCEILEEYNLVRNFLHLIVNFYYLCA